MRLWVFKGIAFMGKREIADKIFSLDMAITTIPKN